MTGKTIDNMTKCKIIAMNEYNEKKEEQSTEITHSTFFGFKG